MASQAVHIKEEQNTELVEEQSAEYCMIYETRYNLYTLIEQFQTFSEQSQRMQEQINQKLDDLSSQLTKKPKRNTISEVNTKIDNLIDIVKTPYKRLKTTN